MHENRPIKNFFFGAFWNLRRVVFESEMLPPECAHPSEDLTKADCLYEAYRKSVVRNVSTRNSVKNK
ncbi:hypothetical protein KPTHUN262_05750 [Klebsiella pneumoniae]|nr:hypothetical protein KPTHUN262_05750 [Klebsiella pneumoniae]DAJ62268.1 MAG TPA: hypothetical protein [Caudoviricetes sp.]